MTSDNTNDNTEVGYIKSHVNPFTKLEKVTLPYEFDDSGPKVVVSYKNVCICSCYCCST